MAKDKANGARPPAAANPERGEFPLVLANGITVNLCLTMAGLAKLSAELGRPTYLQLYQWITGMEANAVAAAIEHLAVSGNGKEARAALAPQDLLPFIETIVRVFAATMPDGKEDDAVRPPAAAASASK